MSTPAHPEHDEQYSELAAGWALHALEPDEEATFEAHLATCGHCRADVDDFVGALGDIARELPAVEPPAGLGRRIREAVRADLGETDTAVSAPPAPITSWLTMPGAPGAPGAPGEPGELSRPDPRRVEMSSLDGAATEEIPASRLRTDGPDRPMAPVTPLRPRRARVLIASVAAGLVLVLGAATAVEAVRMRDADRRADRVAGQLAERGRQVDAAREAASRRADVLRRGTEPGSRLVVLTRGGPGEARGPVLGYAVLRGNRVEIVNDGLPANDRAARTWVLWVVPKGEKGGLGTPRALRAFDVGSAPLQTVTAAALSAPLGTVAAIAVSLEPGRTAPAAPSAVYGVGSL